MIPGSDRNHPTLIKSFLFAMQGFAFAFRTERNIKIMLGGMVFAVVMGLVCQCNAAEWGVVLLGCGAVLSAELMNTSIETVVDLVSPEYHELAARAKDIAAAAVYTLCVLVGIMGVVVFAGAALRAYA